MKAKQKRNEDKETGKISFDNNKQILREKANEHVQRKIRTVAEDPASPLRHGHLEERFSINMYSEFFISHSKGNTSDPYAQSQE